MAARLAFWPALALLCGCGAGDAPLPSATDARGALTSALEAWKAGRPASSLAEGSPKVEVVDFEWNAKAPLDAFAIKGEADGQGTKTFNASLTLKGQPEKDVTYMVLGIDPIRIYRDDDFARAMNMENNPTPPKKGRR